MHVIDWLSVCLSACLTDWWCLSIYVSVCLYMNLSVGVIPTSASTNYYPRLLFISLSLFVEFTSLLFRLLYHSIFQIQNYLENGKFDVIDFRWKAYVFFSCVNGDHDVSRCRCNLEWPSRITESVHENVVRYSWNYVTPLLLPQLLLSYFFLLSLLLLLFVFRLLLIWSLSFRHCSPINFNRIIVQVRPRMCRFPVPSSPAHRPLHRILRLPLAIRWADLGPA